MAGGGVQGGQVIGATDELGLYAIEDVRMCMIFTRVSSSDGFGSIRAELQLPRSFGKTNS